MKTRAVLIGVCAALLPAAAGRSDQTPERRFVWNEANTRVATARGPAEFGAAAQAYERMAAAGVRNGPLFYNLGTALLAAGQYDAAGRALLRAERYLGTRPEIERNLLLAQARGEKNRNVSLPWYRVPLFWHFGLAAPTRTTIAAVAFSLCWLTPILRLAAWGRRVAGALLGLAFAAFVLFGSSAATSLWEEARAQAVRDRPPAGVRQPAAPGAASRLPNGRP